MSYGATRNLLMKLGLIREASKAPSMDMNDQEPKRTTRARRFILKRDIDPKGMSGTGTVAEGVEFTDGSCVMKWLSVIPSVGHYQSVKAIEYIHGHGGNAKVVFLD